MCRPAFLVVLQHIRIDRSSTRNYVLITNINVPDMAHLQEPKLACHARAQPRDGPSPVSAQDLSSVLCAPPASRQARPQPA